MLAASFIYVAVVVSSAGRPPRGCASDDDCNLNGICHIRRNQGSCVCVPEWTGSSCGQLNLKPAKPRPTGGYDERGNSTWGGSIVQHNGTYHMIAARMVGHCGLGAWQQNSEIVRATAIDPEGPYVRTFRSDWHADGFASDSCLQYCADAALSIEFIAVGMEGDVDACFYSR